MDDFREYLFGCRDQALDAAGDASGRLARLLDEGDDDPTEAFAELSRLRPYACWWELVTDYIVNGGLDPMAALTTVRTKARHSLLTPGTPSTASVFAYGRIIAATEATRRFYTDTAFLSLDIITNTGPASPTIIPPTLPRP